MVIACETGSGSVVVPSSSLFPSDEDSNAAPSRVQNLVRNYVENAASSFVSRRLLLKNIPLDLEEADVERILAPYGKPLDLRFLTVTTTQPMAVVQSSIDGLNVEVLSEKEPQVEGESIALDSSEPRFGTSWKKTQHNFAFCTLDSVKAAKEAKEGLNRQQYVFEGLLDRLQVSYVKYDDEGEAVLSESGDLDGARYSGSSNLSSIVSDEDEARTKLFVGQLPKEVTESMLIDLFAPYGVLADVKVLRARQASRGCGFVRYSSYDEAVQAVRALDSLELFKAAGLKEECINVRFADHGKEKDTKKLLRSKGKKAELDTNLLSTSSSVESFHKSDDENQKLLEEAVTPAVDCAAIPRLLSSAVEANHDASLDAVESPLAPPLPRHHPEPIEVESVENAMERVQLVAVDWKCQVSSTNVDILPVKVAGEPRDLCGMKAVAREERSVSDISNQVCVSDVGHPSSQGHTGWNDSLNPASHIADSNVQSCTPFTASGHTQYSPYRPGRPPHPVSQASGMHRFSGGRVAAPPANGLSAPKTAGGSGSGMSPSQGGAMPAFLPHQGGIPIPSMPYYYNATMSGHPNASAAPYYNYPDMMYSMMDPGPYAQPYYVSMNMSRGMNTNVHMNGSTALEGVASQERFHEMSSMVDYGNNAIPNSGVSGFPIASIPTGFGMPVLPGASLPLPMPMPLSLAGPVLGSMVFLAVPTMNGMCYYPYTVSPAAGGPSGSTAPPANVSDHGNGTYNTNGSVNVDVNGVSLGTSGLSPARVPATVPVACVPAASRSSVRLNPASPPFHATMPIQAKPSPSQSSK